MRPHIKLPGLKKHKGRVKKQMTKIATALANDDRARFKREVDRYLRSYAARVVAADYVNRRAKECDRFECLEDFQKAVEAVDLFEPSDEPVGLKFIPKSNGGDCRLIKAFGFHRKVAQRVIDIILREIGETHVDQFSLRGGVNAAVSHVKKLMDGKENLWVAHVDIQSAYGYVNKNVVEELIPLPGQVLNEYLFINDTCPLYTKSISQTPPDGNDVPSELELFFNIVLSIRGFPGDVRSGLSQGAICSPVVLEMLIATDLIDLNLTGAASYADNFLLVADSQEELAKKVKALRAKLKANPCGPFHVESLFFGPASQGFNFLGYRMTLKKGKVTVKPAANNLQKIEKGFQDLIREYKGTTVMERLNTLSRIESKFRQWSATFSQSSDFEVVLSAKRKAVKRLRKQLNAEIVQINDKALKQSGGLVNI